MRFFVGFFQAFHGDVSVDLRGGDAGVAEEGLDAAEIGAGVEHVSGKGVAEFVGANGNRDIGVAEIFLEEIADGDGGDAAAALGDEEGAGGDAGLGTVFLDGFEGRGADGDDALLLAFAKDADGLGEGINMGDIEAGELGEAEAGGVEELEDGGVADGGPAWGLFLEGGAEGGAEEIVHLCDGEDERELALELGELDFLERVALEAVALREPLVEGAQGGEVEADGGASGAGLHQLEEVAAEIIGDAFLPRRGFCLGTEGGEGVAVIEEGARGDVALELEGIEEGFEEAVGWSARGHSDGTGRIGPNRT